MPNINYNFIYFVTVRKKTHKILKSTTDVSCGFTDIHGLEPIIKRELAVT